MSGFNRQTGKPLDEIAHLHQSIVDILTTPIGSRVLRRDYGSRLFDLIDTGINHSGIMDMYQAVVTALTVWEPRLSITNVQITPKRGVLLIDLTGIYRPHGQPVKISGIEIGKSQ